MKATANTVTQGVSARHGDALLATVLVAARLLVWRETWGEALAAVRGGIVSVDDVHKAIFRSNLNVS